MRLRSNRNTNEPTTPPARPQRRNRKPKRNNPSVVVDEPVLKKIKAEAPPLSKPSTSSPPSTNADKDINQLDRYNAGINTEGTNEPKITTVGRKARFRHQNVGHVNDMPDHILVTVFGMLRILDRVKAERVCRKWRYLAKGFAWSNTDKFSFLTLLKTTSGRTYPLAIERPVIGDAEVKSLAIRCGRYLRHVDLHAFRETLSYSVCRSFAPLCPKITTLNLCGIQLTNSSVQLLGRHCPNLEDVNFHRCFQESVVERGLSSFFNKCTRLRKVDVGENERLSGSPSFETLPGSLISLKVGGCYRITGSAMQAVRQRCPNLMYLMMNGVDTLTTHDLNSLFSQLGSLRRLKFGECFISHTIGGTDLNLGPLRNLTELTINDNLLITDRVLRSLVNGCKKVRYLDVSGCNRFVTNEGLVELAKLQYLTHLNLSMMRITNDDTIKRLAEMGMLQAILLHRCDDLSDAAIKKLLDCCPLLSSLDVSFCPKVTNASLRAMFEYVRRREKLEKKNPPAANSGLTNTMGCSDDRLSQLLRYERGLHALMDADLDGQFLYMAQETRGHLGEASNDTEHVVLAREQIAPKKPSPPHLSELHVWTGKSGVTNHLIDAHPLLFIDHGNSVMGDYPTRTLEELLELLRDFRLQGIM